MAKKSMILKQQRPAKFSTRRYNRCKICGRPHAYLRDYGICRICFRELAYKARSPASRKLLGNFPLYIARRACCILIELRLPRFAWRKTHAEAASW